MKSIVKNGHSLKCLPFYFTAFVHFLMKHMSNLYLDNTFNCLVDSFIFGFGSLHQLEERVLDRSEITAKRWKGKWIEQKCKKKKNLLISLSCTNQLIRQKESSNQIVFHVIDIRRADDFSFWSHLWLRRWIQHRKVALSRWRTGHKWTVSIKLCLATTSMAFSVGIRKIMN